MSLIIVASCSFFLDPCRRINSVICLAVFKHNNSSDQGQMNAKPDKIIAYLRPFSQPQVIFL